MANGVFEVLAENVDPAVAVVDDDVGFELGAFEQGLADRVASADAELVGVLGGHAQDVDDGQNNDDDA
mgnify:CR=1 FL=1